jgi:hypothetical protein
MKRDPERGEASTQPVAQKSEAPKQERKPEARREPSPRDALRRERRPPEDAQKGDVQGFGDNTPAFLKRK